MALGLKIILMEPSELKESSIPTWLEKQAEISVFGGGQSLATSCLIDAIAADVRTDHVGFIMSADGSEIEQQAWPVEQKDTLLGLQSKEGLMELIDRRVEQSEGYDELGDDWLIGDDADCKYATKEEMIEAINFEYILEVSRKALKFLQP